MRRYAWILNLDAELELLRGRPGYVPQRKLLAQLAEHGASSQGLLGPEDFELSADSAPLSVAERAGVTGRAWCPTPLAIARFMRASPPPSTRSQPLSTSRPPVWSASAPRDERAVTCN